MKNKIINEVVKVNIEIVKLFKYEGKLENLIFL